MSQFQTLIRLCDSSQTSNFNTQTSIFVVFTDATTPRWKMYLVQTRHKKFFCWQCMLHFFKVTTFLWIILILHLSHTSLFLETVIIKFGGPRAEGRHMGPRAEGREKQIPIHIRSHRNKMKKLCWRQLPISKSLLSQGRRDNNSSSIPMFHRVFSLSNFLT